MQRTRPSLLSWIRDVEAPGTHAVGVAFDLPSGRQASSGPDERQAIELTHLQKRRAGVDASDCVRSAGDVVDHLLRHPGSSLRVGPFGLVLVDLSSTMERIH
jgi:hypothetical protein